MKKVITLLLTLLMITLLVGCSNIEKTVENTNTTNQTTETAVDTQKTAENTETIEEIVEETTEAVEEVKTREPINIAETAAWLDTLPREERYAWYEERYGTYFTDHVSFIEELAAAGYRGMEADMYVYTYIGMPCELLELLDATTVDDYLVAAVVHKEAKGACIVDW